MKVIGILSRKEHNKYYVREEIVNIILKYKCIPINIYNIEGINLCDGVILPGGDNIVESDLEIIKYLYEKDIPTLGICLGMQEMGYLFNGKLGMIDNHLSMDKYVHEIKINKNSKLYEILNEEKIMVNSRHKEYLIQTDLKVSSISNVIESVEDDTKKFFIGVQWHPESIDDINSNKLFNYFIKKISE